jgi:hypothetical protein
MNKKIFDKSVKIFFKNNNDYGPEFESLWGVHNGDMDFVVDNIPIFILGVSSKDVIFVKINEEESILEFESVKKRGKNSTIRLFINDKFSLEDFKKLLIQLSDFNISYEGYNSKIIAIEFDRQKYNDVEKYLNQNNIEYEVGNQ